VYVGIGIAVLLIGMVSVLTATGTPPTDGLVLGPLFVALALIYLAPMALGYACGRWPERYRPRSWPRFAAFVAVLLAFALAYSGGRRVLFDDVGVATALAEWGASTLTSSSQSLVVGLVGYVIGRKFRHGQPPATM
jgi:hypothetical protein